MSTPTDEKFHLVAFDAAGQLVGQNIFRQSQLSAGWLSLCTDLLAMSGEQFSVNLSGPLSHISLRFTAASGAAMATFSANKQLAVSALLLSDSNSAADNEVRELFRQSIVASVARMGLGFEHDAFRKLDGIKERPVVCVVVWGDPRVADDDEELIRELCWHLAGAFFRIQQSPSDG